MVPGAIRILDAIPLTPNGKIDRAALVAREASADFQREYLPPRSATEVALAQIWQEVLPILEISVTDSFFELGGNSLSLLTLYNRISAAYDVGLSVAELFSYHTIEMLANRIDRGKQLTAPAAPADQLEQSIYSILENLERRQIDINDADQAISQLST
jgi:acyl carrier protein